jgi:hypothetical protein
MTTVKNESNVRFEFAEGFTVIQYDTTTWYRKHFNKCAQSAAVDFLVVDSGNTVGWLIEVKDFTTKPPEPHKDLLDTVTRKVRDTLAGVLAGAVGANVDEEVAFFKRILRARKLRVVFHCERPTHPSRLHARSPDPADLTQKLRQSLNAVDGRVVVTDCASSHRDFPWSTTWSPGPGGQP